jgi:hypothetical protein
MSQTLQPAIDWESDPNWVIVDGVPILDEHELHLPAEGDKPAQVIRIDAARLNQIAANNNRRVAQTGDTAMLVEGHTTDDPTDEQPEIVGEADTFRVAPLFQTGRQALWARFKFKKDPSVVERMKKGKFMRRSVELWTDRWEIDPVALLGATAPERDLGVLRLHRFAGRQVSRNGTLRYEMCRVTVPVRYDHASPPMLPTPQTNGQMPAMAPASPAGAPGTAGPVAGPMVDPALLASVMQGVEGTDSWQQMTAVMQQMQQIMPMLQQFMQMMGGAGQPGMGGGMPGQGMGQPGGQMDPMMAMMMQAGMGGGGQEQQGGPPQQEQGGEEEPVRMDAGSPGFSVPSASNTFTPGWSGNRTTNPPRHPMQQYAHNGATVPVQPQPAMQPIPAPVPAPETAQQQVVRLQRRVAELEGQLNTTAVYLELQQLLNEGLDLDPNEELPLLVQMDQPVRMQRYQIMRARYSRRTQNLSPVPGVPSQGAPVPMPAVGVPQPVPQQYQRPQQPGAVVAEAPLTLQEREAVYAELCRRQQAGQDVNDAVVKQVGQMVRYGRTRGVGGQEPVY